MQGTVLSAQVNGYHRVPGLQERLQNGAKCGNYHISKVPKNEA